MSNDEVLRFLEEERIVTCASFGPRGWPHLMPLWYVVRDGRLWAWTYGKSQKVKNLERDPRADVDPAADVDGWPRTGEVPASRRARVWISPERARWAREERTVVGELADGSVIVELGFAGVDWLVREVLKEAGDAVVLEPEDARTAVRAAAEGIWASAGAIAR